MKKIILGALCALPLFVYAAGTANIYDITFVRIDKSGMGYVEFASSLVGTPPTCVQGYTHALSFNTNESGGQSVLALVLAAKASGRKVYAVGTGNCEIYGVMERWEWGYIQ